MNRRAAKFSPNQLDDEFDKFLKESLSDDSIDSDKLNQYFAAKKKKKKSSREDEDEKKTSQPWWMQDDQEDDTRMAAGQEDDQTPMHKWLKPKKQSTPLEDKEETKRLSQNPSSKKETTVGVDDNRKKKPDMSRDSLEDLSNKQEDGPNVLMERSGVHPAQADFEDTLTSYTGTGATDSLTPVLASSGPGVETLEERADKDRFFRELEARKGGQVDFRRLVGEADMSTTVGSVRSVSGVDTMGSTLAGYMGTADEHSGPALRKRSPAAPPGPTPAAPPGSTPGSTPAALPSQQAGKMSSLPAKKGMLSNVALLDTGDSMLNTEEVTRTRAGGERKVASMLNSSGLLNAGTATEMEALQAALRLAAETPTMGLTATGTGERTEEGQVRTVDDIIREVMEDNRQLTDNDRSKLPANSDDYAQETSNINVDKRHGSRTEQDMANENRGFDLQPANENRGFDLQPANENRGFDLQPANENRGFDLQPTDESRGFDLNKVSKNEGSKVQSTNGSRSFELQPANESRGVDQRKTTEGKQSVKNISRIPKKAVKTKKTAGRKPAAARYPAQVKSSGYGKQKTAWSPADAAKQRVKGSEVVPSLDNESPNPKTTIIASVESFANYIREHFVEPDLTTPLQSQPRHSPAKPVPGESHLRSHERALIGEVAEWQAQWKEEHRLNVELKAELAAHRREAERKEEELRLAHQREVFRIRQDNVVLQAKLNVQDDEQPSVRKRADSGRTLEGASEEETKLMRKEIIEQETLLQGYQQENERLYVDVRKLQKANSTIEESLFKENQKLQTDLANTKELLEQRETALRHKGLITGAKIQQEIAAGNNTAVLGAGRITELQVELREAEFREVDLKRRLRQADEASEEVKRHVEMLHREKQHAVEKLQELRDVKHREFQDMQSQYRRETETLHKKLRWYAQNQELLDKESDALRDKDEEIQLLKETLEKFNTNTGQKATDAQRRARERGADAKRIQDLERQVREMNAIIRKRHPNSLPALIYAAAASTTSPDRPEAGSPGERQSHGIRSHTVAFLEDKVRKMEAELDGKDETTRRDARVLEQKYNVMKFQYEDRLQSLEKQLAAGQQHKATTDRDAGNEALLKRRLEDAESENTSLRRRLAEALEARTAWAEEAGKETSGDEKTTREEPKRIIDDLTKELGSKSQELEMMRATCERLMEERLQASRQVKDKSDVPKRVKKSRSTSSGTTAEKKYQPENFTGIHMSDVLGENQQLKQRLEQLALDTEQERVGLHASLAQSEGAIRRCQEEAAGRLAALRAEHAAEVERLGSSREVENADRQRAALRGQVDTQQVMIRHLQERLLESEVDKDTLSAARVRERLLQTQLEQLADDLREAKKSHSPEMRHFEALQAKVATMEAKHAQREHDLRRLATEARHSVSFEKEQEIGSYRELLAAKTEELQRFRTELDAMLEVLRELQRQGVVLPLQGRTVRALMK